MDNGPRFKTSHIVAAAGLAAAAILVMMWLLLDYAQTAPVATQFTVLVAIIALIGTLWTGAISFAGLLLKDSVDRRSAALEADAEKRLRIDTALKAIDLMTKAEASGAVVQESREAALLVITSLNQPRLSIRMADQLWRADKISTPTFVQIVGTCLESDDDVAKCEAAAALRLNHRKLAMAPDRLEYPATHAMNWNPGLPAPAKDDLLVALLRAMLAKERAYWKVGIINLINYCVYKMFMRDEGRRFRYLAATLTREFCRGQTSDPAYGMMPPDRHMISYFEMDEVAARMIGSLGTWEKNIGADDAQLIEDLRQWLAGTPATLVPAPPTSLPEAPPARPRPRVRRDKA